MATTPPTEPNAGGDDHQMPAWVKGFILFAAAAVVAVAVVLATGNGGHGPSRHLPDGEPTTQPSDGHTPPVDH